MLRVPQSHFEGRSQYNPHSQKYFVASAEIFLSSGDFKINIKSSSSEGLDGPIFVANLRLNPKYMNRSCSLPVRKSYFCSIADYFQREKVVGWKNPSGLVHTFFFVSKGDIKEALHDLQCDFCKCVYYSTHPSYNSMPGSLISDISNDDLYSGRCPIMYALLNAAWA